VALAFTLWSLAWVGIGSAQAAPGAALVVYGKADKRLQGVIFGELERSLRAAGWNLVAPFTEAETAVVAGCMSKPTPWTCMKHIVNGKGIDRLVAARADNDGSQLVVTGALVHLASSAKLEQTRHCIACSDDEARSYSADIAKTLLADHALEVNAAKLQLRSEPLGAEVVLDGRVVGLTNNVFITTPGEHTLEVRLKGYQPETRKVTASPGKTVEAAFTLRREGEALPPPPDPEVEGGGRSKLPLVVIGVGVATMVAAGGLFLAFDEDQKTFTSDTAPGYEQHFYDWGVPMAIMAGAGAAVTIAGGVWWWTSRSSTKPLVSTTSHGVTFGVTGSF
jgi:hypothetical protein